MCQVAQRSERVRADSPGCSVKHEIHRASRNDWRKPAPSPRAEPVLSEAEGRDPLPMGEGEIAPFLKSLCVPERTFGQKSVIDDRFAAICCCSVRRRRKKARAENFFRMDALTFVISRERTIKKRSRARSYPHETSVRASL